MSKTGMMPTPTRGREKGLTFLALVVLVVLIVRDLIGVTDAARHVFG